MTRPFKTVGSQTRLAWGWMNTIRNKGKGGYASAYWTFLTTTREPPHRKHYQISERVAADARCVLSEILRHPLPKPGGKEKTDE